MIFSVSDTGIFEKKIPIPPTGVEPLVTSPYALGSCDKLPSYLYGTKFTQTKGGNPF